MPDWAQVGNTYSFGVTDGGFVFASIAALDATTVAVADAAYDIMQSYAFDGSDWAKSGGSGALSTTSVGFDTSALAVNLVAHAHANFNRVYAVNFSGSWALGAFISMTSYSRGAVTSMGNGQDVAFFDTTNANLRMLRYTGSWASVGNSLNISGTSSTEECDLAALTETRVAYVDDSNDELRTYDFDGTDWAQVGNGLPLGTTVFNKLTVLNSSRVAIVDGTNFQIRVFDFNGTDWTETVDPFALSVSTGVVYLAALSSTKVAVLATDGGVGNDGSLETFEFTPPPSSGFWEQLSDHVTQGTN